MTDSARNFKRTHYQAGVYFFAFEFLGTIAQLLDVIEGNEAFIRLDILIIVRYMFFRANGDIIAANEVNGYEVN